MVTKHTILVAALAASFASAVAADSPNLAVHLEPGEVVLTWQAEPLNPGSDTLLYQGFQLEESADLQSWLPRGAAIPTRIGGGTQTHTERIPLAEAAGFYRLVLFVDLSGEDLSAVDLRETDLFGADLTDANLDGAELGGVDLSTTVTQGVGISELGGDEDAPLTETLPEMTPWWLDTDFSTGHSDAPGQEISHASLITTFHGTTSTGELNALLAAHGGEITASSPGAADQSSLLVIRFPTTDHDELAQVRAALDASPEVDVTALDLVERLLVLPDNGQDASASTWTWQETGKATGGNWGLEFSRVPQMWNWNEYLDLQVRAFNVPDDRRSAGIIEGGFADHGDMIYGFRGAYPSGVVSLTDKHGIHVSGTIAARHGGGGIEGIHPNVTLNGIAIAGKLSTSGVMAALKQRYFIPISRGADPHVAINISIGLDWCADPNVPGGRREPPNHAAREAIVKRQADAYEGWLDAFDQYGRTPVVVCAAGNNGEHGIAAPHGSCRNYLAHHRGDPHYLVVGATGLTSPGNVALASFSNTDATVLAPGEGILSTYLNGGYAALNGTSMAAPHVTGLLTYLASLEPRLDNAQLKALVTGSINRLGNAPMIDAFGAVLGIDEIPALHDVDDGPRMLRELLDIDDGTPDGNLRMRYWPPPGFDAAGEVGRELYTKEWTTSFGDPGGSAHPDNILLVKKGDGVIDMSDFRRWRDWLLYAEGAAGLSLDGGDEHIKLDSNFDGKVEAGTKERIYGRSDFNGDGLLDRDATEPWPIDLSSRTDLEVLTRSGLWDDPHVLLLELPDLIDSGDLRIVVPEILFEIIDRFDEIHIAITGDDGYSLTRTVFVDEIDLAFVLWNLHHGDLLFTIPAGDHQVTVDFKTTRGATLGTFHRDITIGLGEDAFFIVDLSDHVVESEE